MNWKSMNGEATVLNTLQKYLNVRHLFQSAFIRKQLVETRIVNPLRGSCVDLIAHQTQSHGAGASVLENSSGFPCAGSGKVRQRAVKADKMAAWWWLLLSPVRTPAQLGEAQKTNSNSCLPHWNSHLAQVSSKACHKNAVLWRTSPATPKIYRANLECMHWTAALLIE